MYTTLMKKTRTLTSLLILTLLWNLCMV